MPKTLVTPNTDALLTTKTRKMVWVGRTPLVCHNIRLADPFEPITKELKSLTSKKKKTDQDLIQIARLEWEGGLYLDEKDGPIIPAKCVEATLRNGAKKFKLGEQFLQGVSMDENHAKLQYEGPRTPEEMWKAKFMTMDAVCNSGRGTVMRCRPKFMPPWKIEFTVVIDGEDVNEEQVLQAAQVAGAKVGLCENRHQHWGRFEAKWAD